MGWFICGWYEEAIEMGSSALKHNSPKSPRQTRSIAPFLLTFFILFGIWLLLSGRFDGLHISLGVISCLIVAFLSTDLLFTSSETKGMTVTWLRFLRYIPWLLHQVFLANIHVLYLTFHPRMMDLIDPEIIRFRSKLKSNISLLTFANSITLTPGTITVYVSVYGDFQVHAIDKPSGRPLPGEMEERVGRIFGE
tara:strand:- start:1832 stop:2413 length:582 start_codon:yes stop_codon:yes gene_type:complete